MQTGSNLTNLRVAAVAAFAQALKIFEAPIPVYSYIIKGVRKMQKQVNERSCGGDELSLERNHALE
jgi:hypothetical protein